MEARLQEVIDKIKNDGVKSAEEAASKIVQKAQEKAGRIVKGAQEEAEHLLSRAQTEADGRDRAGLAALRRAGRDLLIEVRNEVQRILTGLLEEEVEKSLSPTVLSDLITVALTNWRDEEATVLVSPDQCQEVESLVLKRFQEQGRRSTVTIRPHPDLEAGFRVSLKEGRLYYDFSNAQIVEMLTQHLGPRLAGFLGEPQD